MGIANDLIRRGHKKEEHASRLNQDATCTGLPDGYPSWQASLSPSISSVGQTCRTVPSG